MSRVGRAHIELPEGVKISVKDKVVTVAGPKGTLTLTLPEVLDIKIDGKIVNLTRTGDAGPVKAMHGLNRMLLANMIMGAAKGFEENLELSGVGYRASLDGKKIVLTVGFSHPVEFNPPQGISFAVEGQNKIKITGFDKQLVGQIAADIRAVRPVEPYKGKGIKYAGEHVRKKAGKAAKTAGG